MRKKLDMFANISPVITFESLFEISPLKKEIIEGVDFVIICKLIGGIYFGELRGCTEDGLIAFDTKRLTFLDKANVLTTSRLWRETIKTIEYEYPEVIVEYLYDDNASLQIIQWPKKFDVIVIENMFGDIISSDEVSLIIGPLGILPWASFGELISVFKPIHNSYLKETGLNIANPLAAILSVAMLLKYKGLIDESNLIYEAFTAFIKNCN